MSVIEDGFNPDMDIYERGLKAIEGFYPVPYEEVDKTLREATRQTGERIKEGLRKRLQELETNYGG